MSDRMAPAQPLSSVSELTIDTCGIIYSLADVFTSWKTGRGASMKFSLVFGPNLAAFLFLYRGEEPLVKRACKMLLEEKGELYSGEYCFDGLFF